MKIRANSGFTLVELLVAIALGLVILAGVYQTFRTQHDSYIVQDQVAAMQQNLRAAMYLITRDLQMAGWYTNFDRSNRDIDLDDLGMENGRPLLFSLDNSDGAGGNINAGTDALVILKGGSENRPLLGTELASGNSINLSNRDLGGSPDVDLNNDSKKYGLLVKSDLRAADLFVVDTASGTITNPWSLNENYLSGDLVFRADIIIYKVNNDATGRPTLYRRNLGNDNNYQVVAENIDNMQVRYQLNDGSWVNELVLANQAQVRAVEVILVGRTAQRQRGYTDTNTYDFANNPAPHIQPQRQFQKEGIQHDCENEKRGAIAMKRPILNNYRISPFGRNDGLQRKCFTGRQQGWTLIEILVAIVVLTVGLLAVGTMQISAIRGNFMGGNTSIALTLASQKMEDLFNRDYDDADLVAGVHEENVSDSGVVDAGGFYRRTWDIADMANPWPDMKEITVVVTWENDRHRVNLRSMRRP
jgi:prepilin-type N-terminal cleavage/methylation domain-containing protein